MILKNRTFHDRSWHKYAAIALLFIFSFSLHYIIELKFDKLGVFNQWNILFNADVNKTLLNISHHWGDPVTAHLNLSNFFNPPIRITGKLIAISGISNLDEESIRYNIALIVTPLCGALKTILIFSIFTFMGLKFWDAIILTILDMFCFSQMIFGSLPEHFPISGFLFACLYCVAIGSIVKDDNNRKPYWLACGVLLFGVTITNIIPFAMVFLITHILHLKTRNSIFATIKAIVFVIIINLIVFYSINSIYTSKSSFNLANKFKEDRYLRSEISNTAAAFPLAIANTLIATKPQVSENQLGIANNSKYKIMFTYEESGKNIANIIRIKDIMVIGIIIISSIGLFRSGRKNRYIGFICLCTILFNWILHSFYGDELFLYSQHWQVPLLILLSGLVQFGLKGRLVLLTFVLTAILINFHILAYILNTLSIYSGNLLISLNLTLKSIIY